MPEDINTPIPGTSDYTQNFIAEKIRLSFGESSIDQFTNNILARPNQGTVKEDITSYEMSGGPSDVTAFHDFHIMKIAFEDVWQEVFNTEIPSKVHTLYGQYVQLQGDAYSGLPHADETFPDPIESVEELKQALNDLKASIDQLGANSFVPELVINLVPSLTSQQWIRFDGEYQCYLMDLGDDLDYKIKAHAIDDIEAWIRSMKDFAAGSVAAKLLTLPPTPLNQIERILVELDSELLQRHKFDVFAPDSYNFGLLVTYRQTWVPGNFQVGDLINTIPLAPKETRKYSKKAVIKKSRQQKEMENSSTARKMDSDTTARVDAEIINKASNKTNFKASIEGGFDVGVGNAKASAGVETDAASESSQTKKDFREAVKKTAEEYKQEHKLDIDTSTSNEFEENVSGEITNPNDELTVTYLFYELQRQYNISEKIHKLTPLIMVAREVPGPDKIDEAWIIANDWILRRVILDDSFLSAIDYIVYNLEGDNLSLKVLKANLDMLTDVVKSLKSQINDSNTAREEALNLLKGDQESLAHHVYVDADAEKTQAVQLLVDQKKAAYDRSLAELADFQSKLSQNSIALQQAVDNYSKALQVNLNKQTEILRLKVHLKNNILYYMQAIWDTEVPDQRFFSLYNIEVCRFAPPVSTPLRTGKQLHIPPPAFDSSITYKLHEIADIDNVIGYKGNYQIFALKVNNPLTVYMMQEYIEIDDGVIGIRDPDILGGFNEVDFKTHVKEVYEKVGEVEFNSNPIYRQHFENTYMEYLSSGYPETETIVVPTKSLYIEALPGKHPLLEDFKLAHRAMDVKKVQAEVRHAELENLRLAARLLSNEREDPDIDKKIVVEGGRDIIVTPTE